MTRAALLERGGTPLQVIDDLTVAEPHAAKVRLQVAHAGLCHSDLYFIDATPDACPPVVLGHEVGGIIESVGPGVTRLSPGDHVRR